jgi:hypothetical protein
METSRWETLRSVSHVQYQDNPIHLLPKMPDRISCSLTSRCDPICAYPVWSHARCELFDQVYGGCLGAIVQEACQWQLALLFDIASFIALVQEVEECYHRRENSGRIDSESLIAFVNAPTLEEVSKLFERWVRWKIVQCWSVYTSIGDHQVDVARLFLDMLSRSFEI